MPTAETGKDTSNDIPQDMNVLDDVHDTAADPAPPPPPRHVVTKSKTKIDPFGYVFVFGMIGVWILGGLGIGIFINNHFVRGHYVQSGVKASSYKSDAMVFPDSNHQLMRLADLIGSAHSEVLVMANTLSSRSLIDALGERARQGVRVFIILNAATNPPGGDHYASSPLAYMVQHQTGKIFIDRLPNFNEMLIVDNRYVVVGNEPFSTKAETTTAGTLVLLDDPDMAEAMRQYYTGRGKESMPVASYLTPTQ